MRYLRLVAITLALTSILSSVARADDKDKDKDKAPPPPVVTDHEITLAGGSEPLKYKATTGKLPLKDDSGNKTKAEVFYIAYEKTNVDNIAARPITFAFNGGPGSSSVWLHMGALGPRRPDFGKDGEPPAPPTKLSDNEYSWLDLTDIVFIDPVSTGFSRAAEGEDPHQFHGLSEDIRAVGEFIRLYTTRQNRWLSPKFLVGESYGTTRASGLAGYLQDELGMSINGIVLVSPVLNFQTLGFDNGNDMPYWLFLPTYTATAWYHKMLKGDLAKDLPKATEAAMKWASTDYLQALAKGDKLTDAEKKTLAEQLSKFTGLSQDYVTKANFRVRIDQFTKELLREQAGGGRTVGRYDSRYKGIDRSEVGEHTDYDPSYAAVQGPFTAALNSYVRTDLKYETDLNYEILTGRVHPWNLGASNHYAETAEPLRHAMTTNPNLHLMVCTGYYDLATPFFAADYTVSHLGLDPSLRNNAIITRYEAGHMMYLRRADLEKLKKDATTFYEKAVPK
jgi:carboxypeptidase C (cathepsin A)